MTGHLTPAVTYCPDWATWETDCLGPPTNHPMPGRPDFEEAVLEVLENLPEGQVISYGEVASAAGYEGAARAVGNLLRRTGEPVPWWRVVSADGRLAAPDTARQAARLRAEGIPVKNGRLRCGDDAK